MTMKKMIALVCVLVMMPCMAMAEIDLSGLSVDELIALRTQIMSELFSRGEIKEAKVPAGEYIVGEDIPAGAYTVTTSSMMLMVAVDDGMSAIHTLMNGDSIGKLVLEDGQKLQINGGAAVFSVYQGISFE